MQPGDFQVNVNVRGLKSDYEGPGTSKSPAWDATGMTKAATATPTGYRIELAIPWAALRTMPAIGRRLGANAGAYDCDDATCISGGRQSFAWTSDGSFSIPDAWPTIVLGAALPATNVPPVARVSADVTAGTAPLAVMFDASASSADAISFAWDFGDGTTAPASTMKHVLHTYSSRGTHVARLTVTDAEGAADSATVSIAVNGRPTAAIAASATSGSAPLAVSFDSSGSGDVDGTIVSRRWDFSDGTPASTVVSPSHTFTTAGTFTVTLTVTDDHGATDVDTVQLDVTAPASTLHIFNPATYAATLTYDPNGIADSSPSFQKAIDDAAVYAAAHASQPQQFGLFVPPPMKNAANVNVGPDAPQAVVRVNANGIFKLDDVYVKSNVRIEIHASSTLIPRETDNAVMLYLAQPTGQSTTYVTNVTVTAYGQSVTFRDTGRRCTAAGRTSPCALTKTLVYPAMTFPDGTSLRLPDASAIDFRFTVDRDARRYPNADHAVGNTPRGGGVKTRQVKSFLVEKMYYLAYHGDVLNPADTPPGPGAIGSNTYPATAGNGLSMDGIVFPPGSPGDFRSDAVQPRNGTARFLHCEDCTRGYGMIEIHSGVDLEYDHISTRGGIAVRWESSGNGRSTRQTARQLVGMDCNTAVLMSTHEDNVNGLGAPGPEQDTLKASFVKAIGCDNGFRSETAGGTNVGSSFSDAWIYPGTKAQVIRCRGGATCTGCRNYGVACFDDDAWTFKGAQTALHNRINIPTARTYCDVSQFAAPNLGSGTCAAFPP